MTKWGSCDFDQLVKLQNNLQKLQDADMVKFCNDVSKELAARLLSLVIPETPVGNYKREVTVTAKRNSKYHKKGDTYTKKVNTSGKNGGTLRRGWIARTEAEAQGGKGRPTAARAKEYAQSLPVTKVGNVYRIEVINPVNYASYVEFGHRTRSGKGWVKGQYFLTVSEQRLRQQAPGIIERKLYQLLMEAFNV